MAARTLPPVVLLIVLGAALNAAGAGMLAEARSDIRNLRYRQAEEKLLALARTGSGSERLEALYLLAGLKRSAAEAEILYRELMDSDPEGEWGRRAALTLAEIRYATGDYRGALELLHRSFPCGSSEEVCLFQGLSCLMLGDYDAAAASLGKVRRGRFRVWADLALAEIDRKEHRGAEACQRYRDLARAMVNPVALYRYGECLESEGRSQEALKWYQRIIEDFSESPEAVKASAKIHALEQAPSATAPARVSATPEGAFTVQLGAFQDRANALRFLAEIRGVLPGVRIDTEVTGRRELHRVRYGYFRTREEAQAKADEIRELIGEEAIVSRIP